MHKLAKLGVGDSNPARIMGIINVSPESFYKKSVFTDSIAIKKAAKEMEEDGFGPNAIYKAFIAAPPPPEGGRT